MFSPQWLASFRALIDQGSFTRAAEQLGLTQAAVSQHLRQLENQLGPLVLRRSRQLELTPAGSALLDYCHQLEQADQALRSRLSDADALAGEVSLITPGSIGLMLYPFLLGLQQTQPGLAIRHRFAPDSEVLDAVAHSRYELGLSIRKPDDPRLSVSRFAEEALELVVPAGRPAKSWQALAELGFIDHPDGQAMATRLLARRFPGNPGVRSLPQHGFSNQIGLILEPVARGLGFTVIPQYARQAFAQPDAIEVIDCEVSLVDTLWLVQRAEWPLSRRASWVLEQLHERVAQGL